MDGWTDFDDDVIAHLKNTDRDRWEKGGRDEWVNGWVKNTNREGGMGEQIDRL